MLKRILIGIGLFIVGFTSALLSSSFFRKLIQDLFQWTTNNQIQFGGKDLHIFGNPIYFTSFGLALLIFSVANKKEKIQQIGLNAIIIILIFGIALIGICALNAHLKLIECTACLDGIRRMGYKEIDYGLILTTSTTVATIPSLLKIFKNLKKQTNK